MGHGTEHHKEQNPGTGYYKGHDPGTEHEKGNGHGVKHFNEHQRGTEQHKAHCFENIRKEATGDHLVEESFAALTATVVSLNATIEMLVQKIASMAYHIVATEEILAEIISENGLNLAPVNTRIRARISVGTDSQGDSNFAVDVAASIASRLSH